MYDADCGPCTSFKRAVQFLNAARDLRFAPLQVAYRRGLLDRVDVRLRFNTSHLVLPGGDVLSGPEYLPELAAHFPLGGCWRRSLSMTGAGRAARSLFLTMSRLHGKGACSPSPEGSSLS